MPSHVQRVHVVMWEPADPESSTPFEFVWSRDWSEVGVWRARILAMRGPASAVYSATLPLPEDGDFADDTNLEASLRHILGGWPRNQPPPPDQTTGGCVEFVGTARGNPRSAHQIERSQEPNL
jgi:hypothetical protein